MLGEHNITYRPRTSVKGHILADFLVENPDENPPNTSVVETPSAPWTLFTDGSSCVDGSGASEYETLIDGLRIAAQMGVHNVQVNVDSKLVANQVPGTYVAEEKNMIKYLKKVKSLVSDFANFSISQVPRSKYKKADALSKIASTSFAHLSKQVLVEYLKDGTLHDDRNEASKLRIKARQYELMEGILYRRSFLKSWLRTAVSSSKGYAAGILLADYAPGRKRYDMYVQRLSSTSPRTKKPSATANPDHGSVAKWIEAKAVATITGNQVKKF
ncbi:reverse transcriptase domain-containing protein, partial [Tanacetum coccineum]